MFGKALVWESEIQKLSKAFFFSFRKLLLDMGLEKKAEEASNVSKGQDRGESIHVKYLEGLKRMRAGKRDEKGV